jgi:uncharacterized repeat protein (TIGR03837 family)
MAVTRRCDIYCRVVDNFGDIGVAWRLARQLGDEYGWRVRLIVDDLASFKKIAPQIQTEKLQQWCVVTEVFAWNSPPIGEFGDLVIEAFGCDLPDAAIAAMAAQVPPPRWLNLEYLSAEAWVAEHHLLPSTHPRYGISKTFFFPGFTTGTGGLIRERHVGLPAVASPRREAIRVFMFGYDLPASRAIATAIAESPCAAQLTVPMGALADQLLADRVPKVVVVPFVPQPLFDSELANHDILFVRGEDSFVRAQWAGKPFIWQIYPQAGRAHEIKLAAFLARYCPGLGAGAEEALRGLWAVVNDLECAIEPRAAWVDFCNHLPEIAAHARAWTEGLMRQPDLASNLVAWVEKSAKTP